MISHVSNKTAQIERIAALCGMVWLVSIIDACFTWFFPWEVRHIIGSLFVFYATILLSQNHRLIFSKQRRTLFFLLMLLATFMVFRHFQIYTIPFKFGPLMCIVFWNNNVLQRFYKLFRSFIIFYAVLSIIVEVCVLTRLWVNWPCIKLPPQDNVQEALGYVNYFYGLFSIQSVDYNLDFYRACGPLREGGHFSLFLGFVYFADKAIFNRRSIWILVCGVLTLSPNFLIAFILTEGYAAIKQKKIIKPVLGLIATIGIVICVFFMSPDSIQDEIVRVVLERTLEESVENAGEEGLVALIDGRAGVDGLSDFDFFVRKSLYIKLIGMELPEGNVMSDFRYLIMLFGFVGSAIIVLCTISFSVGYNRNLFGFCLFLFGLLILIHRSWMFVEHYHWTIMFLLNNMWSISVKTRL